MMMPTVISTLDHVASQVRSSAGMRCVSPRGPAASHDVTYVSPASDHLQIVEEMAWACLLVGLWPLVMITRH